jgi:hypothetical protein
MQEWSTDKSASYEKNKKGLLVAAVSRAYSFSDPRIPKWEIFFGLYCLRQHTSIFHFTDLLLVGLSKCIEHRIWWFFSLSGNSPQFAVSKYLLSYRITMRLISNTPRPPKYFFFIFRCFEETFVWVSHHALALLYISISTSLTVWQLQPVYDPENLLYTS